jgi:hypothetical protein
MRIAAKGWLLRSGAQDRGADLGGRAATIQKPLAFEIERAMMNAPPRHDPNIDMHGIERRKGEGGGREAPSLHPARK